MRSVLKSLLVFVGLDFSELCFRRTVPSFAYAAGAPAAYAAGVTAAHAAGAPAAYAACAPAACVACAPTAYAAGAPAAYAHAQESPEAISPTFQLKKATYLL